MIMVCQHLLEDRERGSGDSGGRSQVFSTLFKRHRLPGGEQSLSHDQLFHLLGNRRRRFALHFLKQVRECKTGEIAEQVAAWENGVSIEAITSTERKRVYNSLQQTHLPKLRDTGLILYDPRSGHVELTEAAVMIDIYLEISDRRDVPWSIYYLGLSGVGIATVLAVHLAIYPFGLMSSDLWLLLVVVVMTVSSVAHVVSQRRNRLGSDEPPPDAEVA